MNNKHRYYNQPHSISEPNWKSYIAKTTGEPVFTPEQCNKIIDTGRSQPKRTGKIGKKGSLTDTTIRTDTRLSHISWIPFGMLEPMYRQLETVMHNTNKNHFGFDNMQLTEQAQYTEYSDGGFYNWHMDSGVSFESGIEPVRKISMSLLLNHENEFEGGELELCGEGNVAPLTQGHAIFFASFLNHRVKPVTKGVRKSLVVWFGGTPFK